MIRAARSAVIAVLAALVSWFAVTPSNAMAEHSAPLLVYAYDGLAHTAPANDATTERGPPATHDQSTVYDAVDLRSRGASARLRAAGSRATYDYNDTALLVQSDVVTETTSTPSKEHSGDLSSVERVQGAAKGVPETNKIFSNRVLQRMADEPGPYHNFPGSFDKAIFSQGTRTTVPNYFNKAKPNLSNDSIQYRLPGELNGRAGVYEIFTRPSASGRTELIMHRFFRPY